jgi:hypothetical protein
MNINKMRQRQQELDNGVHQWVATSPGPLPSGGPLYWSSNAQFLFTISSLLLHNILHIFFARPPCSDPCMLPQTPLTNMTKRPFKTWEKAKIHKLLLQFPASKSYPQASKGLVYISFRLNKRILTSPEDLASLWDQILLQMAKISSKNHVLVIISGKIIKN